MCPKIKQHALNASWQKCVLQISQARFIHLPLSQRSTWASICWSKPGQSSVFSSATSNQWKFKGLLKDWAEHMWLRRSACQLQGAIQPASVNLCLAWQCRHSPEQRPLNLLGTVESAMATARETWSWCLRYLLGRACAMLSAPDGRVSHGMVCKPFTSILSPIAGSDISCTYVCFSQEKGLSKWCCNY